MIRRGNNQKPLLFRYSTINGVAKRNLHFLPKAETIRFEIGEMEKVISVDLVEDANWRPKDVFYVNIKLQVIYSQELWPTCLG